MFHDDSHIVTFLHHPENVDKMAEAFITDNQFIKEQNGRNSQ